MAEHTRKSAVLSNGSLAVGLNEDGLVSDFYYPYVGENNLTNSRRRPHYIGVWVDGDFTWLHESGNWQKHIVSSADALEAHCEYSNQSLGITLATHDFVDPKYDMFRRTITVSNHADKEREVRLFFYQNFRLSQDGRTDTVMYVPDDHYIYDYKGTVCLLIAAEVAEQGVFDQWAVGNTDIEGKEGTFRDAEDGELSNSRIEHSSVDSTIRCLATIGAHGEAEVRYWICAGDSQYDVERMHAVARTAWNTRAHAHAQHWNDWLNLSTIHTTHLDQQSNELVKSSLLTIKAHADRHGGVIASIDSSIFNYGRDYYSYVWPRDGVYVMRPLLYLGHHKEPLAFLEFCSRTMKPGGYMQHKYQPDGAVGSTWHPLDHYGGKRLAIQEDETASVLQLAVEYYQITQHHEFLERHYENFIAPMADFLVSYRHPTTKLPYPSYDLWEEKLLISTYTVAMVIKALRDYLPLARAHEGDESKRVLQVSQAIKELEEALNALITSDGYYAKGIRPDGSFDETVDISSLYGVILAGVGKSEVVKHTFEEINSRLVAENGGVIRYENDNYFTRHGHPNPWFVATLWLAQCTANSAINDRNRANELLNYCLSYLTGHHTQMIPEQISPDSKMSKIGVTPLIWSHAELIQTIMQIKTAQ